MKNTGDIKVNKVKTPVKKEAKQEKKENSSSADELSTLIKTVSTLAGLQAESVKTLKEMQKQQENLAKTIIVLQKQKSKKETKSSSAVKNSEKEKTNKSEEQNQEKTKTTSESKRSRRTLSTGEKIGRAAGKVYNHIDDTIAGGAGNIASLGLAAASGGVLNPLVLKALGVDKLATWAGKKVAGGAGKLAGMAAGAGWKGTKAIAGAGWKGIKSATTSLKNKFGIKSQEVGTTESTAKTEEGAIASKTSGKSSSAVNKNVLESIDKTLKNIEEKLGEKSEKKEKEEKPKEQSLLSKILSFIGGVLGFNKIWPFIKSTVGGLASKALSYIAGAFAGLGKKIVSAVWDALKGLPKKLGNLAKAGAEVAKKGIDFVKNTAKKGIDFAKNGIKKAAPKLANAAKTAGKGLKNIVSKGSKFLPKMGKLLPKVGLKGAAKAIPGLGALVGAGFALNELRKGNFGEAAYELATGLMGPAGLAVDVARTGYEMYKDTDGKPDTNSTQKIEQKIPSLAENDVPLNATFNRNKSFPPEIMSNLGKTRSEVVDPLQQALREDLGANSVLTMTSSYRDPDYNRAVGGARSSRHLTGKAVDLQANNASPEDLIQIMQNHGIPFSRAIAERAGSTKWLHVEYDESKHGANETATLINGKFQQTSCPIVSNSIASSDDRSSQQMALLTDMKNYEINNNANSVNESPTAAGIPSTDSSTMAVTASTPTQIINNITNGGNSDSVYPVGDIAQTINYL